MEEARFPPTITGDVLSLEEEPSETHGVGNLDAGTDTYRIEDLLEGEVDLEFAPKSFLTCDA